MSLLALMSPPHYLFQRLGKTADQRRNQPMLERDMGFKHRDTSHTTLNAFIPDSKTYFRTGVSLFHVFQNSPEGAAT